MSYTKEICFICNMPVIYYTDRRRGISHAIDLSRRADAPREQALGFEKTKRKKTPYVNKKYQTSRLILRYRLGKL